jgi:hypothetical protein
MSEDIPSNVVKLAASNDSPTRPTEPLRCKLGLHQYSKWAIVEEGAVMSGDDERPHGRYLYQQSVCQLCGKTRMLRTKYS